MTTPSPEDDLIARHFAPWAGQGSHGLKDDAATLCPRADWDLVVTTDALVAGVHFFPDDPPETLAIKALGVNLSDLAAKGAGLLGFLLTLVLPRAIDEAWLVSFSEALRQYSDACGCTLLGGDTTSTPGPLTISITAFGEVPRDRAVTRLTARTGEIIAVSGTIGDAALGLRLLLEPEAYSGLSPEHRAYLIDRYRRPQPRLALAKTVRDHAGAAMDVSDGLIGDTAKLLRASGRGGELELAKVPLSPAARALIALDPALFDVAVTGGDDYEIVMTVPPASLEALTLAADAVGVSVNAIGQVGGDGALIVRSEDGGPRDFARASFSHF